MSKLMYGAPPAKGAITALGWARDLAPLGTRKLKVIWDVSNKCNLRCRMCHFSFDDVFFREAEYIKPTLFEKIAESVLPLAHTLILSAGNEPLTSPFFTELLKISAKYSIPNVLFITNGQRLRPKVADAVIESGVTQVQISIDGATKDTYEYVRRGARFDRLIHNIEYITERKRKLGTHLPQLQFNLVLMRRNLHELDQFVD